MSWRRWTAGPLLVALIALCPVAHASPIDPTWIAGFWDDGDHDAVVILIASMISAADMNVVALVSLLVTALVARLKPESFSARALSLTAPRAPPIHA